MMMRSILFIGCLLCGTTLLAQVPEFDRLEMYYAQGHYKMVHRKANRLLDKPDYDYSQIPSFYKALSLFQLSQNKYWLIRNPTALDDAEKIFTSIRKNADGQKILVAHMYEVSALKKDLISWAEDLKRLNDKENFDRVQGVMQRLFEDIPDLQEPSEPVPVDEPGSGTASKEREELVAFAKKFLGTPYVWAGDDPSGFDCSGFTGYVFKNSGVTLPRRAVDQYEGSRKIKEKSVEKGDLIFFDNGSGISHVGIVISERGKPVVMIHSSSSKGIVVSDIESSEYWRTRVYGYGSYLD
jgi:cell wall-associated NlpC family hydrolase